MMPFPNLGKKGGSGGGGEMVLFTKSHGGIPYHICFKFFKGHVSFQKCMFFEKHLKGGGW